MNSVSLPSRLAVIKIGTDSLKTTDGQMNKQLMHDLMRQCVELRQQYEQVFFVSSGAVLAGAIAERIPLTGNETMEERQALAAIGQSDLIYEYGTALRGLHPHWNPAQIMVDQDAFSRDSGLDGTLAQLLQRNIIPIFNWNDPLHTEEVQSPFGNNDQLALHLAQKYRADALVLLTNIDGVRRHIDDPGTRIVEVSHATLDACKRCVAQKKSEDGTGGMGPKIDAAAEFAFDAPNRTAHIARARDPNILRRLLVDNELLGTTFTSVPPKIIEVGQST